MINYECVVHGNYDTVFKGYISEIKEKTVIVIGILLNEGNQFDVTITIPKSNFEKSDWNELTPGHYVALDKKYSWHVCCCYWTQEEIDQCRAQAKKLFKTFKENSE